MAAPAYAAAGAGAEGDPGTTGPLVPFPAGISAGHLLLMHAHWDDPDTFPAISGWTKLYDDDLSVTGAHAVYAKSASGSESGTQGGLTSGSANECMGRMYRFTDWLNDGTMTANFEGASSSTGSSTSILDADVTTTDVDRLCVQFVAVVVGATLDAFSGETGGDWAEAVAEYGAVGTIGLQVATLAAAGTIGGGTNTISPSRVWGVRGFAILPAATPLSNFYPDYTEFPKPHMRTVTA